DAVKDVPLAKKADLLLLGIYLFYEKSSLNRSILKRAHNICQVPFLVPTRAIVLHVQQIQNPDDPAYHKDSSRKAKNYLLFLTSADIVQYLHLLQDVKRRGRSNTFKTARRDMLTSLISSLNKRFIDMAKYSGNEDFGDSAVQALAQALEKTLMEAEVNPTLVEDEWTELKSYIYKTTSADAEHGFSPVKLIETDWRSRLTDDHLTDLMVVQLQTVLASSLRTEPLPDS
ncbi:hypothetical protein Hamer_G014330, partial [Homarus americanus]